MKTLIVLICLFLGYFAGTSQNNEQLSFAGINAANPCAAIYSEQEEGIVYEDPNKTTTDIVIQSIPPAGGLGTPVKIVFIKGTYTFYKGPGIEIPGDCHAYIEDQLTGQNFDLSTGLSYTFKVSRTIPDRFVLHVDKNPKLIAKHH
jgi:hypothetical protein